jgi:hypothetical protein
LEIDIFEEREVFEKAVLYLVLGNINGSESRQVFDVDLLE